MSEPSSRIPGVVLRPLTKHTDSRGWLVELIREDDLPAGVAPRMAYLSVTRPGIGRGPHEHRDQTDVFCFLSGTFSLHLWDRRPGRPRTDETHIVGEDNPVLVTVPPGVIHGYRNVGQSDAFVVNLPDRLYAGWGKREPVDEIRHEDIGSEFAW
ncbi:MAG: dTDP-4-dehydrorhamnose 3,5-epimerase [Armatimonadetes bacterium]|nr:dTDP-4-dehydrorhamnose 3,5-epimerase [Armatimonadota bacterium]